MVTYVGSNAKMFDNAIMFDNAKMFDNAIMQGNASMYDNAILKDTILHANAKLSHNALVTHISDYIVLGPAISSGRFTTAFIDTEIGIRINCGCFSGNLKEFLEAINTTHANNQAAKRQYLGFLECIKTHFAARMMLAESTNNQDTQS